MSYIEQFEQPSPPKEERETESSAGGSVKMPPSRLNRSFPEMPQEIGLDKLG
jgi:hypothetical protein